MSGASGRPPPWSREAERSVLGGLMLDPDRFDEVADIVRGGDFFEERHAWIFNAIAELRRRGVGVDTVMVREALGAVGKLNQDLDEYLVELLSTIPVVVHIEDHAQRVRDLALQRAMIAVGQQVAAEGYGRVEDVMEYLDRAESAVLSVSHARRTGRDGPQHIKVVLAEDHRLLEEQERRGEGMAGASTGLTVVDEMTTGLYPGDFWIIGGRPSMGKTSFGMQIIEHLAEQYGPVAVFSLEMTRIQLVRRMKCGRGRVDMERLRSNRLEATDWSKLTSAARELEQLPIIVDDNVDLTPMRLRSKCRRVAAEHGQLAGILIDYLQLMKADRHHDTTEREVADTSRSLKLLAKEMGCPLIALSQLNREVERRSDKRPGLSDLRYSGALEQDADVIGFLYRDEVYNKKTDDTNVAEVIIGKQRNGPTGTVRCAFFGEYFRFYNLADEFRDEPEAPPPGRDWSAVAREAAQKEGTQG